jgi:hypothetical protein
MEIKVNEFNSVEVLDPSMPRTSQKQINNWVKNKDRMLDRMFILAILEFQRRFFLKPLFDYDKSIGGC